MERPPAEKLNDGIIFWPTKELIVVNWDISDEGSILATVRRATPESVG